MLSLVLTHIVLRAAKPVASKQALNPLLAITTERGTGPVCRGSRLVIQTAVREGK